MSSPRETSPSCQEGKLPVAKYGSSKRPLIIGEARIGCYVLDDGRRVLSQRGMEAALQRAAGSRKNGGNSHAGAMPTFLGSETLKPWISAGLSMTARSPILFKIPTVHKVAHGYPAEMLPEVCWAWIDAYEAGVLQPQQERTALAAKSLIRGLAATGIIALVDEATGYQADREAGQLSHFLSLFLSAQHLAWAKKFPDDFYEGVYRLKGWGDLPAGNGKKMVIGRITNDLVYERLPDGVLEELRRLNPRDEETGRRPRTFHQHLTPTLGLPALDRHLTIVVALMKNSASWEEFMESMDRVLPKRKIAA